MDRISAREARGAGVAVTVSVGEGIAVAVSVGIGVVVAVGNGEGNASTACGTGPGGLQDSSVIRMVSMLIRNLDLNVAPSFQPILPNSPMKVAAARHLIPDKKCSDGHGPSEHF
jgi:hypothetical protein